MEDLEDFLEGTDTRPFSIQIGAQYIKGNLSITDHRKLAEWMGVYNYILPAKRILEKYLYFHATRISYARGTDWLMDMIIRLEHISVMYSEIEQQQICTLLQSKNE